jgi:hypothetical protein
VWVNKSERAWRRRGEAKALRAAAAAAEMRFAAFARALADLLPDPEGCRWLQRAGVTSQWCARSQRMAKAGAEGLSVLEGVVLVNTCSRLLDDAAFVRWLSQAKPDALRRLHDAAKPLGDESCRT